MAFTGTSTNVILRMVLTISALIQINAYAATVLWSLLQGPANLAIPIVLSFLVTFGLAVLLDAGELVKGFRGIHRGYGWDGHRMWASFTGMVGLIVLFVYGGSAIFHANSTINLSQLDPNIRVIAVIGTFSLILFTVMIIHDFMVLFRKDRSVPKIAPPRSGAPRVAKESRGPTQP